MDEGARKTMEWPPPSTLPSLVVRSPRQTVSLIRNRRPHRDWDQSSRSPSFAARDHGPKPSEVYGFVGSITTVIATAAYLAWAYTPEPVLRSLGITYYPSKYWALAVPSFVIVAVALSMAIYMGLNFVATPPLTSFMHPYLLLLIPYQAEQSHGCYSTPTPSRHLSFAPTSPNPPDENSRERMTFSPAMEEEMPIEPISDISIDQINDLMFGGRWFTTPDGKWIYLGAQDWKH
ncbi:phosphatidylinositol N-acetylglucosaminyltransferase subunit P-like isoform X2 [Panicum virgatum]|uniref:phosphatidylinositol N-acetylglucosaminyltransferase subunit P-like isoform X2 n=1 Tax=Panicum virgatum TaxID=38727 RepID=UPI0019D6990C|nr:phosphatidylinositol N-acetylglucosaminyltransferase subunit P-like isoform X2 [Panicum virgatum]